jgi:hypothetical protein
MELKFVAHVGIIIGGTLKSEKLTKIFKKVVWNAEKLGNFK